MTKDSYADQYVHAADKHSEAYTDPVPIVARAATVEPLVLQNGRLSHISVTFFDTVLADPVELFLGSIIVEVCAKGTIAVNVDLKVGLAVDEFEKYAA